MKKLFISALVIFTMVSGAFAQDYMFTMPLANQLNLNPAFAGSFGSNHIVAGYDMAVLDYKMESHIVNLAYDNHIDKIKGGIGVKFSSFSLNEGNQVNMSTSLIYSYYLNVKEKFVVKPAVEIGYGYNTLSSSSGLNNFNDSTYSQRGYMDLNIGLLSYCDRGYIGFALKHLTNPNISFYDSLSYKILLPMFFTAHVGGFVYKPGEETKFQLSPSIVFNMQGSEFMQFCYGLDAKYKKFKAGVTYVRNIYNNDNFACGVGYDSEDFEISYAHNFIQGVTPFQMANHEVKLSWNFKCKKDKETTIKTLKLISL